MAFEKRIFKTGMLTDYGFELAVIKFQFFCGYGDASV